MPASGFAREVRFETKKVRFMVKKVGDERVNSDNPQISSEIQIKKTRSCERVKTSFIPTKFLGANPHG
jgi:hypothetical protein